MGLIFRWFAGHLWNQLAPVNLAVIGSENGLSTVCCQAIIFANTNFFFKKPIFVFQLYEFEKVVFNRVNILSRPQCTAVGSWRSLLSRTC